MTIGDIKQGIRQRCRFDPRLTDDYILNYIKQGLAKFSISNKPYNALYTILMSNYNTNTVIFDLPKNYIEINCVEIGTINDFTNNTQTKLTEGKDYEIVKIYNNNSTGFFEYPKIKFNVSLGSDYLIKINYTAYIDEILTNVWPINGAYLDNLLPLASIQPLIEYVAYQHKKNYLKDQFTQFDYDELNRIESDLSRIFNERVEII